MAPVLIVEDNEINAEIISTTLEMNNIPNEISHNGIDSIQRCKKVSKDYYSLVLMDIHMPELNGYETAKILKNELEIKAPVIAQTATHTTEETKFEHQEYIVDYIFKPFKPEELLEMVKKHIV